MQRTMALVCIFILTLAVYREIPAEPAEVQALKAISERLDFFEVLEGEDGARRIIYADANDHIHVYRFDGGRPQLDWEVTSLGSPAAGLCLADLGGDGKREIVIATTLGRLLVYDAGTYDLLWENHDEPYEGISCMISADIDDDPQDEIVLIADGYLRALDGLTKAPEWQSQDTMDARKMLVANTDDDDQLELILNSGVVYDTRFNTVEFESETAFGDRMTLFDLNGDGIPEVLGQNGGHPLRIFDLYAEREIW